MLRTASFTLVRAAQFTQSFIEGALRDPVFEDVLPMPGGDVLEPIIDVDDIAYVAVAAPTEERWAICGGRFHDHRSGDAEWPQRLPD